MATKIRLARRGRGRRPYYHIVVADSRSPRDGKFIEKLGVYNPLTNPATIELNFEKAVDWAIKGAEPTNTVRAILSYKGVLIKKHLQLGVAKGAITQAEADKKFDAWVKSKAGAIEGKKDKLSKAKADAKAKALEAERKVKEDREAALKAKQEAAAKATEEAATAAAAPAPEAEAPVVETPAAENPAEGESPQA